MSNRIKSLNEVSEEINEELGKFKLFNPQNGFFPVGFRESSSKDFEFKETKIRKNLSFHGTNQEYSFGYFKSQKGYNSKFKNTKDYADYYGEYLAYIILKQLGKKACKVDIGELETEHPYKHEPMRVKGILSHLQLGLEDNFRGMDSIIDTFKQDQQKQYRELTERGKTNSDKNYTNIELVFASLEHFFRENGQEEKIPDMRKKIFDMCIFDIKFSNRDRHEGNFGVKINWATGDINMYPLFDNEQILGLQENRADVQKYLSNEKEYEKFKKRELTSCIGFPGKTQKVMPNELLMYLLENYHDETVESLKDFERYQLSDLEEAMEVCTPGLSSEHKELAKRIFTEREKEINETLKTYEERHSKNTHDDDDSPSL